MADSPQVRVKRRTNADHSPVGHISLARCGQDQDALQPIRLVEMLVAASAESDRSAAILYFAFADGIMLKTMKCRLAGDVTGGWSDVTSGNGLLATEDDRITLLKLLGWIQPTVYKELRTLKRIRDHFARDPVFGNFAERSLRGHVASLHRVDEGSFQDGMLSKRRLTPRQVFLIRGAGTIVSLASDLALPPIGGKTAGAQETDGTPEHDSMSNVRELREVLGKFALFVAEIESEGPTPFGRAKVGSPSRARPPAAPCSG